MYHLSNELYFSHTISILHVIWFKHAIVLSWQHGIPEVETVLLIIKIEITMNTMYLVIEPGYEPSLHVGIFTC